MQHAFLNQTTKSLLTIFLRSLMHDLRSENRFVQRTFPSKIFFSEQDENLKIKWVYSVSGLLCNRNIIWYVTSSTGLLDVIFSALLRLWINYWCRWNANTAALVECLSNDNGDVLFLFYSVEKALFMWYQLL